MFYNDDKVEVREYWVYKKGLLVLHVEGSPGVFVPALKSSREKDSAVVCAFASGQFFEQEWEERIRKILPFADTFIDFVEDLDDRGYDLDAHPPSKSKRHFRRL